MDKSEAPDRNVGQPQVPGLIQVKNSRELTSYFMALANRRSSKSFKLLFSVIKANTIKIKKGTVAHHGGKLKVPTSVSKQILTCESNPSGFEFSIKVLNKSTHSATFLCAFLVVRVVELLCQLCSPHVHTFRL